MEVGNEWFDALQVPGACDEVQFCDCAEVALSNPASTGVTERAWRDRRQRVRLSCAFELVTSR